MAAIDTKTAAWIEEKIREIGRGSGHGYVAVFWHLKCGRVAYKEKIARETETEQSGTNATVFTPESQEDPHRPSSSSRDNTRE